MQQLPVPSQGQKFFALGDSGTGKTTLLRSIFGATQHGIMADTKEDDLSWLDYGYVVQGDEIFDIGEGRYIWRPGDEYVNNMVKWNIFFQWLLDAGNRMFLADEWGDIVITAQVYPLQLKRAVMRGRSRRLSLGGGTQEPLRIPSFLLGQAHHRFVFNIGHPDHRDIADRLMDYEIPWEEMNLQFDENGKPTGSPWMYRDPLGIMHGPYKLYSPTLERNIA